MNELCIYLEVIGIKNANTFLVYIPSKYNIKAKDRENTFEISYINVNDDGTIVGEYANDPDDFDVENTYDNIIFIQNRILTNLSALELNYNLDSNIEKIFDLIDNFFI